MWLRGGLSTVSAAASWRRPAPSGAILFAVASLLSACSGSPVAPTPVQSSRDTPVPVAIVPRIARTRYLAFGDSLTGGTTSPAVTTMGAGLPSSYPFKLLAMLAGRYRDQAIEMFNEGKGGEAAEDGVLRFPGVMQADAPEVVILLHGVNDVSFYGARSIPRIAGYVQSMARDARQRGADVLICTEPPHRAGGSRAADPALIAAYNRALRDVAVAEGAQLVDFETTVDLSLIGADGLHPTEDGYVRMAQILFDALRQRYELAP
ncbi:MAG TPA: SGNH/GDSL hydrolase family protein [Vicinamibacterales bacterium]|nr:SGNH/GDSL hydrolase family protein [Vicinamibacterales bacterium]